MLFVCSLIEFKSIFFVALFFETKPELEIAKIGFDILKIINFFFLIIYQKNCPL